MNENFLEVYFLQKKILSFYFFSFHILSMKKHLNIRNFLKKFYGEHLEVYQNFFEKGKLEKDLINFGESLIPLLILKK